MSYNSNRAPQFVPLHAIEPETIQQVVNYGGNHELSIWLGARILTAPDIVNTKAVISQVMTTDAKWSPTRNTVRMQIQDLQFGDIVHKDEAFANERYLLQDELSPYSHIDAIICAQAIVFGYLGRYSLGTDISVQKVFGITPTEPGKRDMGIRQAILRTLAGNKQEQKMKPLSYDWLIEGVQQFLPDMPAVNIWEMGRKLARADLVLYSSKQRHPELTLHPKNAASIRSLLFGLEALQDNPQAERYYREARHLVMAPSSLPILLNKAGAAKGLI